MHLVLNKNAEQWEEKTWNGLTNFYGRQIWTDGIDIYWTYYDGSKTYVLHNNTWEQIYISMPSSLRTNWSAECIWYNNNNTYYNSRYSSCIFNRNTMSWDLNEQYQQEDFYIWGAGIWKDERNTVYCGSLYVLNSETNIWQRKTWNNNMQYWYSDGGVWTDGRNIYFAYAYRNSNIVAFSYMLNKYR